MNDYVDKLWNSDAVACLDALKEADKAVETINRDMFSIIADVAAEIAYGDNDEAEAALVKDTLRLFEQRYKKERSLKHMPGSYRSAKSTIVNAVKHGIALGYEDGSLKGKSALEKEINQAKKQAQERRVEHGEDDGSVSSDHVENHLMDAERHLNCLYPRVHPTSLDREEFANYLNKIDEHVEEIRKYYGV